MSNRSQRPPRKNVGSPFENSIQSNLKKNKSQSQPNLVVKYKPLHERQFYHSQSNQVFSIGKNQSNIVDSEDEVELLDIERHQKIINANRHLSQAQKSIMNLWNQFIEKRKQFGIKHMKHMCKVFIDVHISDIRQQTLYRDFLLHLCTLHHAQLLLQKDFFAVIEHLHGYMNIGPNPKNHQSTDKENHVKSKRKRPESNGEENLEPKPKQQRYGLRARNRDE